MKYAKMAFLVMCLLLAACTSSQPTYPNAGLRVYSEGKEILNRRLIEQTYYACEPPGCLAGAHPSRMIGLVGPDLNFVIRWDPVYRLTGDQYDFMITYNKTITKRRIVYKGKPMVLAEDPYRVVIDTLYSNK